MFCEMDSEAEPFGDQNIGAECKRISWFVFKMFVEEHLDQSILTHIELGGEASLKLPTPIFQRV